MALGDLENIFGNAQDEKKPVSSSNTGQSRTVSADPLNDIFANSPKPTAKQTQIEASTKPAEEQGFLGKTFDKAASVVGKVATSVGDWLNEKQKNLDESAFQRQELFSGTDGKMVKNPVTGKSTFTTPRLEAYNTAKTPEERAKIISESNQQTPVIKFLNSETGKKITGGIASATSNVPLKIWAGIKSLGDDTYDEAYSALLAKEKDPNNSHFEKIMYGLQDSGAQSAIGALLSVGASYLSRNPNVGKAVSLAYFAPISAESQRQEKGRVESVGNIAIDTVGDTVISGFAENALKSVAKEGGEAGVKAFAKQLGKGFAVEGTTEPAQTFLKYANDYKNAGTEADKKKVVANVTDYVKNGGMVDEFLIGGLSGAGITGVAAGAGKLAGGKTNIESPLPENVAPEATKEATGGTVKGELSVDFSKFRDEVGQLQQELSADPQNDNIAHRLSIVQDQLNDYQQAVKDRPVYVSSDTQDNPLAVIETVKYPDGKFSYSFSADTEKNSVQAPFLNSETYATKAKAVAAGKKAVLEWVQTRIDNADPTELAKFQEIKQNLEKKPRTVRKIQTVQNIAEEPLFAEARKYKSAEEFINSQPIKNSELEGSMSHRPSFEDMPPAYDLLKGGALPNDVYEKPDFSIGNGAIRRGEKAANESWNALQKIKGKPDELVTIYRASPVNELRNGDWITLSKEYAKSESFDEGTKVHSFKVKAKDIIFAGDDINEFGYWGHSTAEQTRLTDLYNRAQEKSKTEKPNLIAQSLDDIKKYSSADKFIEAIDNQGDQTYIDPGIGVMTETGKPALLMAYHGTDKDFEKFIIPEKGIRYTGDGVYFTPKERSAKAIAGQNGRVIKSYLDLKSPYNLYLPEGNIDWKPSEYQLDKIRENGHDGIVVRIRDTDTETGIVDSDTINEIVVFNPDSIKTKAQLGEIWEKANKSEKPKPKNPAPVIRNTTQNQVEKKPVKTKGEVKNSKAFQRVQERLGEYADMDVNYNRLNLAKDSAKALEFIEKYPKEARRIALGMQGAPEGVTETAISIALAEKAAEDKNYALQAQLERSRSLRQTRRGQEIVAERGRFNENSPHFFMQQVLAARIEQAGKVKFKFLSKNKAKTNAIETQIKEGTESIKQAVKKKLSAADLAQQVIDAITC